MPLYAAMAPNQNGVGIPLWYMVCTTRSGHGHEQQALEITLKLMFQRMGCTRPKPIVIDKSWVEFNAIRNVLNVDPHCLIVTDGTKIQNKCIILLCWFHVKKPRVEYLLAKSSTI